MTKFTLRAVLILWPIASFVSGVAEIFYDRRLQWDLRNYLAGVKALASGLNPYVDSAFIYPPLILSLFARIARPFTYDQIYVGLLAVKLVALAALLLIWRRYFLRRLPLHIFVPLVLLGFNATILIDLAAGNLSVVETTLLFAGFACVLKDRRYFAAAFVVAAASLKIAPIVFLLALLTRPGGTKPFLAGVAAFGFYLGLNYGWAPGLARDFVAQALARTAESELINPSSLALIRDVVGPGRLALGLWAAFALGIVVVSWRAWRARPVARTEGLLFLILVYVIASPRMKDYAYMLALPSALFVIPRVRPPRWAWTLPLLLLTARNAPTLFETPYKLFWNYHPWFVALAFWAVYVGRLRGGVGLEPAAGVVLRSPASVR